MKCEDELSSVGVVCFVLFATHFLEAPLFEKEETSLVAELLPFGTFSGIKVTASKLFNFLTAKFFPLHNYWKP